MSARAALHLLRDQAVRLAAHRPFRPIPEPTNRIVIVRPDHFGDMLMLEPALRMLEDEAPGFEIVLMTGPWNRAVTAHIAPDTTVVTYEFPGFQRGETATRGATAPYRAIAEAAELLRELRPRAILLMRDDHWWGAWMAREAGIPLRFGYADPQVEPFLTHPMEIRSTHYVQQNIELTTRVLTVLRIAQPDRESVTAEEHGLDWPVDPESAEAARTILESRDTGSDYIVVHPGTGAPVKRWPVERWARVIDCVQRESEVQALLTGSPDESWLCEEIAGQCRTEVMNLAGETTLFTLAEVLRGAKLVLGVDSGPLHLGSAVKTPTLHLYGPSDHVRYGPWGNAKHHRVIRSGMSCPACGNLSPDRPEGCGCMMAITVEQVAKSAIEMLNDDG